jgi:hypothetical protein
MYTVLKPQINILLHNLDYYLHASSSSTWLSRMSLDSCVPLCPHLHDSEGASHLPLATLTMEFAFTEQEHKTSVLLKFPIFLEHGISRSSSH